MNHDKNNDDLWGAINRIEASVKNSQADIKKLFLHSTRQEIAIEALDKNLANLQNSVAGIAEATAAGFTENRERFDQLELLIRQSLPNN